MNLYSRENEQKFSNHIRQRIDLYMRMSGQRGDKFYSEELKTWFPLYMRDSVAGFISTYGSKNA